ncbi:ATP-binding protein, partial [Thiomonas sp.]
DRFYRVDPSRQRRGEGAGLGLAIVKSIVEAHAGQVEVTSENGKTCFSVRLPGAHLSSQVTHAK